MDAPRFQFGQVVILDNGDICLVCKTWSPSRSCPEYTYDLYCRNANSMLLVERKESELRAYVFSKSLTDDEKDFYQW